MSQTVHIHVTTYQLLKPGQSEGEGGRGGGEREREGEGGREGGRERERDGCRINLLLHVTYSSHPCNHLPAAESCAHSNF